MDASHLLPKWAGIASLVLIVNNFLSYSGMEMNAVHVSSLRNPHREFPKAMFFACGLVLLIFILPALAISWVVPAQQLSLTAGVMQAFSAFFGHFNLEFLVPIVAIALVCASAGGMLTWLAGPSKGLVLIARQEGYMPPFFQRQNENGIPVNILLVQGGITTVIALLYALIPSVSSAYWILSVMTTQVYLIVYLLMFVAARQLRRDQPEVERGYRAPWLTLLCAVGFLASAAAIVIGFVPPSQFGDSNAGVYALIILAGTVLIGLLPAWLFLKFRKPSWQRGEAAAVEQSAPPAPEPPPAPATPEATVAGEPASGGRGHRRLYWIIGVVVAVLVVVGLLTYNAGKNNQEAKAKAQELTQKFEQAGLPVPADIESITRSLGTDGGAVCDNPANALGKAIQNDQLTNGADFVGRRPVRIDRRIVIGEALILQTYCPDKLAQYQKRIDDLKYANTIKP
jgi:amino acid transporter